MLTSYVCIGPLEAQALNPARIALSIPIINVYSHSVVAGPVFASHPLDLQVFPLTPSTPSASESASDVYAFTYLAPVGAPSMNVEAKLTGVNDDAIEGGSNPCGMLHVRGPSVGRVLQEENESGKDEEWLATGHKATVYANGTFKIAVPISTASKR